MAGFRNILVHHYLDVDIEKVYSVLQDELDHFLEFVKYVEKYLSKTN